MKIEATSAGHGTNLGTADEGITPTMGVTDKWCADRIGDSCAMAVTSFGSRCICMGRSGCLQTKLDTERDDTEQLCYVIHLIEHLALEAFFPPHTGSKPDVEEHLGSKP